MALLQGWEFALTLSLKIVLRERQFFTAFPIFYVQEWITPVAPLLPYSIALFWRATVRDWIAISLFRSKNQTVNSQPCFITRLHKDDVKNTLL